MTPHSRKSRGNYNESGMVLAEMTIYIPFLLLVIFSIVESTFWIRKYQRNLDINSSILRAAFQHGKSIDQEPMDYLEADFKDLLEEYLKSLPEADRPKVFVTVWGIDQEGGDPVFRPRKCIRSNGSGNDTVVVCTSETEGTAPDFTGFIGARVKIDDAQLTEFRSGSTPPRPEDQQIIVCETELAFNSIVPSRFLHTVFSDLNPYSKLFM